MYLEKNRNISKYRSIAFAVLCVIASVFLMSCQAIKPIKQNHHISCQRLELASDSSTEEIVDPLFFAQKHWSDSVVFCEIEIWDYLSGSLDKRIVRVEVGDVFSLHKLQSEQGKVIEVYASYKVVDMPMRGRPLRIYSVDIQDEMSGNRMNRDFKNDSIELNQKRRKLHGLLLKDDFDL